MFGSKRARPPTLHAITFKENVRTPPSVVWLGPFCRYGLGLLRVADITAFAVALVSVARCTVPAVRGRFSSVFSALILMHFSVKRGKTRHGTVETNTFCRALSAFSCLLGSW